MESLKFTISAVVLKYNTQFIISLKYKMLKVESSQKMSDLKALILMFKLWMIMIKFC